jgi:hypothetical protein
MPKMVLAADTTVTPQAERRGVDTNSGHLVVEFNGVLGGCRGTLPGLPVARTVGTGRAGAALRLPPCVVHECLCVRVVGCDAATVRYALLPGRLDKRHPLLSTCGGRPAVGC